MAARRAPARCRGGFAGTPRPRRRLVARTTWPRPTSWLAAARARRRPRAMKPLAKRAFGRWDARLALLASRGIPRRRVGSTMPSACSRSSAHRARGDEAILLARTQAELALARGPGPADAIAALATVTRALADPAGRRVARAAGAGRVRGWTHASTACGRSSAGQPSSRRRRTSAPRTTPYWWMRCRANPRAP